MQPKAHTQRSHSEGDESLLSRIQRRDESALAELYDRHSTAVYSLALRIVGDRAGAEDVLSDVFWRIWKAAESHDPKRGSVIAWIMTIARRRAIDQLRADRRRGRREESPQAEEGLGRRESVSPEGVAAASEVQLHVRQALAALSSDQRTPIELAFFEGLTHVRIAERLGQPLGTIKTRIRTGMHRMREQLGPFFERVEP